MESTDRAVLSADTTRDAEDAQVELWRAMGPEQKVRLVAALCRTADAMALAGIRQRHQDASPRECFLRLAVLKLGTELARRVYPDLDTLSDLP